MSQLDNSKVTLDELIAIVAQYFRMSKPGGTRMMKDIWAAEDAYLNHCDAILEQLNNLKGLIE